MPISVDENLLRLTNADADTGADADADPNAIQGVLLGRRCRACGITVFGPATFCQSCTSPDLDTIDLSPTGILYSYTIVRVPPAGWPGPTPYILGEVELPEGPHVLAEVIDCPHDALTVGMPVTLALQSVSLDGSPDSARIVYKWRPA